MRTGHEVLAVAVWTGSCSRNRRRVGGAHRTWPPGSTGPSKSLSAQACPAWTDGPSPSRPLRTLKAFAGLRACQRGALPIAPTTAHLPRLRSTVGKLVLAIAERFTHYEMRVHLKLLRAYYARRRLQRREDARAQQTPWDVDMILQWAALWRIPPLDCIYAQLPNGAPCPCGQTRVENKFTVSVFPEGHTWMCGACGATWLVVDTPP